MQLVGWLRRSSPAVRLYLISAALYGAAYGMVDLLLNLHLMELGYKPDAIGRVLFVGLMVMGLAGIPIGMLADRFGARWFLVGGSLLYGISLLELPWSASLPVVAICYAVTNLSVITILTTEFPVMSDEVAPAERTTLFSLYFTVYLGAQGLGMLAGGKLIHLLPAGPLSHYQLPLLTAGVLAVGMGALRVFLPLRKAPRRAAALPHSFIPSATMLQILLLSVLSGISSVLTLRFLNVVLRARFQMADDHISLVIGLTTLCCLLGAASVPYLARQLGPALAAALIMLVTFGLLVTAGVTSVVLLFVFAVLLRQALHYTQLPLLDTLAMGSVETAGRSTINGYRQIGRFLGMAIGTQMYGPLLATGQFWEAFLLAGLVAAAASICYYAFFGRQRVHKVDVPASYD